VGPVLAQATPGVEEAPKKDKKKTRHGKPPRKNRVGFALETELADAHPAAAELFDDAVMGDRLPDKLGG
jgi:hypothetical protein